MIWVEQHKNMQGLYNALDLNVLATAIDEGFPNAIAEGMSCATLSVGMRVGDVPLIIEDSLLNIRQGFTFFKREYTLWTREMPRSRNEKSSTQYY